MTKFCKNVSSRPTGLFCRLVCRNESACNPLPATTTQLTSQSLSSHTLCGCFEVLSTTNNLCNFWHSKFQYVSTYAFCSWDDIFTQECNCSSPNNLCRCIESPSTLSTNTSIEWNLYLSQRNHLGTSFRLEINAGGFFEHQNKTRVTDRYKKYFSTACISQANVKTMKRFFEQRSELHVAKCLINHVLSSSFDVSNFELRNTKKATQHWSLRVANDIVLNHVRKYHDRVYADNVLNEFWLVRSLSSQPYSKFITKNSSEKMSQFLNKECKTRFFIWKVNLNFLRPPRHFNCDTVIAVIVSFLKETVHGFNNIREGRVKTGFHIVNTLQLWKFHLKKHIIFLRDIFVHWWVGYFWNCNFPLTFQIQLFW